MITYNGVEVCLETPDLRAYLEKFQSLDDLAGPVDHPFLSHGRARPLMPHWANLGLPTRPTAGQRPPEWKINRLYWPQGASRWAIGLVLMTGSQLRDCLKKLPQDGFAPLRMSFSDRQDDQSKFAELRVDMMMLPPRPITGWDHPRDVHWPQQTRRERLDDPEQTLWLVPLVDRRWLWQFLTVGNMRFDPATVIWEDVLTQCEVAVGRTFEKQGFDGGFGRPHWLEFARRYQSVGPLIDAVAASTGKRFVAHVAIGVEDAAETKVSDYALVGADEANTSVYTGRRPGIITDWAYASGFTHFRESHAGGFITELKTSWPETIQVVYPKGQGGYAYGDGSVYTQTRSAREYMLFQKTTPPPSGVQKGAVVTLYSTALADFSWQCELPTNCAALNAQTESIVSAWVKWRRYSFDKTVSLLGIDQRIAQVSGVTQPFTGLEDYAIFDFGVLDTSVVMHDSLGRETSLEYAGKWKATLRLVSREWNDFEQHYLTMCDAPRPLAPQGLARVQLLQNLPISGEAEAKILYYDELTKAWNQSAQTVLVMDALGKHTGSPGDKFYVVALPHDTNRFEVIGAANESATTTTSTTTTRRPCSGKCKWSWIASAKYWSPVSNDCAATTTTTTTGTTTTTTTTTNKPCPDNTTTTGNPCPTTTTTTSTSTTAAPSCQCLYPDFCGNTDGEVTYTGCTDGDAPLPVTCTSTTTTSSPTTTTTTCNCNTTTTTTDTPDCGQGCDWLAVPKGGWFEWKQIKNNCSYYCPCPVPAIAPSDCATAHTDCKRIGTPAPPQPGPCTGGCTFWWVPSLNRWVRTEYTCDTSIKGCDCHAPSYSGSICAPVTVSCSAPATTTTTAGPCWKCYTTTSTTTTPAPCRGCQWVGTYSPPSWQLTLNECMGEYGPGQPCTCSAPPWNPYENGETAKTYCYPQTTTTTTQTTTTTCCPTGRCNLAGLPCQLLKCVGGAYTAPSVACNCPAGYTASPYVGQPCTTEGFISCAPCQTTTTTTAAPTTTTTITTATPPPGGGGGP